MSPHDLNLIGLAIDAIGAIILFWKTPHPTNAPPPHPSDIGAYATYWTYGIEQDRKRRNWLRFGFCFMIAGFLLQLIAAFA